MSHGLLEILRYFLLALLWLFFIYAIRMVVVEVRRGRADDNTISEPASKESPRDRGGRMRLRIVDPPELRNTAVDLGGEVTIGRSSECMVSIPDDTFASSIHARVFPQSGELWIEDLGSTNGTFVNNRRLAEPVRLRRGDRIKIGNTLLEVTR